MKKGISLFLAFLLMMLCALPAFADGALSVYSSNTIPTGSVRMTAHRGYSSIAPENTLPAFRLAGQYGFWGAECDISTTSDGVWVIMHDETVDRMTDGEGKVSDFTYDEIRALTIDAGNSVEQFPGTKIPTLTEYLDVCGEYSMHPVIEIKACAEYEKLDDLADLLSARPEKDMFVIITFSRPFAARIKQLLPEVPVYLLIGGVPEQEFLDAIQFCLDHHLDGIDFACVWEKETVKLVKKAGLKTMVWTVDNIETAEKYYKMGVRDITTNTLTPMKPAGNGWQRFVWALRDWFYRLTRGFRMLEEIFDRY